MRWHKAVPFALALACCGCADGDDHTPGHAAEEAVPEAVRAACMSAEAACRDGNVDRAASAVEEIAANGFPCTAVEEALERVWRTFPNVHLPGRWYEGSRENLTFQESLPPEENIRRLLLDLILRHMPSSKVKPEMMPTRVRKTMRVLVLECIGHIHDRCSGTISILRIMESGMFPFEPSPGVSGTEFR